MDRSVHPYFIGVQSHPEFKNRLGKPSPLYLGLLLAASGKLDERFAENDGFLFPRKQNEKTMSEEDQKRLNETIEHFESYVAKLNQLNSIEEVAHSTTVEEEEKSTTSTMDAAADNKALEKKVEVDGRTQNPHEDKAKSENQDLKTLLSSFETTVKEMSELNKEEFLEAMKKLKAQLNEIPL